MHLRARRHAEHPSPYETLAGGAAPGARIRVLLYPHLFTIQAVDPRPAFDDERSPRDQPSLLVYVMPAAYGGG